MDETKSEAQPAAPVSPYVAGLACRCPRCGRGKLFAGFLTLRPNCEACGLENEMALYGRNLAACLVCGTSHAGPSEVRSR